MNFDNFVGGEWIPSSEYIQNINPSDTSDMIGQYARADLELANHAITEAHKALPLFRLTGVQQRADALDFIGNQILARRNELGDLLAREEGKTLVEATGEVARAGNIFKFFAGEALRLSGVVTPSVRNGVTVEITREPVGVVGVISPWNFPIAIPAWKIAPALAYGNCVIFKPAELVPASAWALTQIISQSGLPKGVFNLVMGTGSQIGNVIVEAPMVNAVSFTGSVQTGRKILAAAFPRQAKVQLEMGGKNPLVVLDDANLDVAVECAVQGAFYSTGQRCTASSRLIVTEAVHDKFIELMQARMKVLKVGDARDPATDIGPLVDNTQLEKSLSYIAAAQDDGALLSFGGQPYPAKKNGYYLTPALLTGTDNDMRINREEVFGPVATVIKANDYEEAVAIANDTEFGLAAGICTTSLKYAADFKQRANAGMVMVNLPTAGVDYHVPFGGTKNSSYGPREQGTFAKEFYTTIKTSYVFAG